MSARDELEDQARTMMAEVCQLYGIPTGLGAAWGVLFASPSPMSPKTIATAPSVNATG